MKRILIVDDEALIRYCLSMMLGSDDREVTAVANGGSALKEINEHPYDLCLLDIHLPDMNGLDIMKIIKIASPATKIIIMTASEIAGAAMQSVRENAHWFISKPFDLFQVTESVDKLLLFDTPLFPDIREASAEYASVSR